MKIAISNIKIVDRIRKEVGKVEELAESIRHHGLISPIAVMPLSNGSFQLLAGLRRLRAMEHNGETEIDAKVFPSTDAEMALQIEYSENEQREPFTYSEKMDYARLIEEIEREKARKRMLAGKPIEPSDPVPHGAQGSGKRRNAIGAKIGMSGTQYDRAKYIAANAAPEIIDQLDRGERTIRGTYDELRAKVIAATTTKNDTSPIPVRISEVAMPPKNAQPAAGSSKRSVSSHTDPRNDKIRKQESECVRKWQEFEALSPNDKIHALEEQLRAALAQVADLEFKLNREKELRQNEMYHYNGTIDLQNRQIEELSARVAELELKYESER